MKPSSYDGQRVLHVDGGGFAHSGVVVGQSDDDQSVYVQAREDVDPKAGWDFAVSSSLIPALIKAAKAKGE